MFLVRKYLFKVNNKCLSPQDYLLLGKLLKELTQPAFTYSKLTIETLEQGMKYVQS